MASISELNLNEKILTALRKGRINSVPHILALQREELAARFQLTQNDIKEIYETISRKVSPCQPCSALDIWNGNCEPNLQHSKLSLGCPIIDAALRGGLLLPGINEISGESGSGKTQIALQLCLTSQFSRDNGGLNAGALFISTEDAFPTKRLHQLSLIMEKKFQLKDITLMDNIFIEHAADVNDLMSLIKQRVPCLLMNSKVKFIVIDSVAALFRVEYSINEAIERSKVLSEFGQQLHRISHKFRVAILCINQISDVLSKDGKGEDIGGRRVVPALGLPWSTFVTCRIMVMRTPYTLSTSKIAPESPQDECSTASKPSNYKQSSIIRKMKVLFAPHIGHNECHYVVEEDGVRGIQYD
eukprot:gene20350-22354_t